MAICSWCVSVSRIHFVLRRAKASNLLLRVMMDKSIIEERFWGKSHAILKKSTHLFSKWAKRALSAKNEWINPT
ncbi:hypothetical protein A8990_12937 [Paenibacillus taihuensis]|uniref:Uncharacterized protein n=1 Tax=Paenibacillus taihuensis TaxID=1156355 RepID=A0A3D9R3A4_9BACL|nr:hypothetical protein A8990_12937 [Paenibacillus taihuensis]